MSASDRLDALRGSMVALATPMHAGGEIDFACIDRLVDWHIAEGSDCLVATGTTGESPTLDHDEHVAVIERCLRAADGRIPIIAGTGSNSTREAIDLSRRALKLGVAACLQVAPYYNRPPQAGLVEHFAEIARQVPGPHILYNVPARTGVDILPQTVLRLSEIDNIVGIKEASGSVERARSLREQLAGSRAGFLLWAGEDAVALDVVAEGAAVGCISVTANVAPRAMHRIMRAAIAGDLGEARKLDESLRGLHRALFLQTNPIPVKWALVRMGRIPAGIRLPLVELAEAHQPDLLAAMQQAGIELPAA